MNIQAIPRQFQGSFPIHLRLSEGYHLAHVRNGRLRLGYVHPTVAVPAALGACVMKLALQLAQGKGKRHGITPQDMRDAEVTVSETDGRFHVAVKFPHIPQAVLESAAACCAQVHQLCPVNAMLDPELVSGVSFSGGVAA